MQMVKFASHRAREKALGKVVAADTERVFDAGGVYGTYMVTEIDYFRIKEIKGVSRIAGKSDPLPTPCIL